MLKHNLLIIFRNFRKNKSTFLINLIGLSTGLACALLIYLWVNDELHVDKFNKNDSRLFQVMENAKLADRITTQPYTPDLMAETMAKEIPEIKYAAAVTPSSWFSFTLSADEINFKAEGQFAGKDFFNIFSFGLLQGNPNQVLTGNNSVVISKELAMKLFKTTKNVVGKTIKWQVLNFSDKAVVTGICNDVPNNSTMQFQFVLSYQAWKDLSNKMGRTINWDNHAPYTYVLLKKGTNPDQFNKKIAGYLKSKFSNSNVTLFARHYSDGYLYGKYDNGIQSGGRIEYVKLFSVIALFIILIACINFMNLFTAKASTRMKEVGIKKAMGAERKSLIIQYLSESLIISLISLFLALLFVELLLPQFNNITGKQLSLNFNSGIILTFLSIVVLTGLISGSYPALYISGFKPVSTLKGKFNMPGGELWLRKVLVVFQFSLSIIFIAAVLVVYKQIDFIQTKNLGYDRNNVISFDKEGNAAKNQGTFLSELKKIPGVVDAASANTNLMGSFGNTIGLNWQGKNPKEIIRFESMQVSYNLIKTLDINIKEGRSFSKKFGSDSTAIIFNETAIKTMGLKNPIGKIINLWGVNRQIIGVTKNFNFESLHETIKPLFFILEPDRTMKIMVKLKAGEDRETINNIKNFYSKFNPGYVFDYKFLDKDYQALYESEERVSVLSKYFAGLAIMISCLGLLGLAAFTAQRRIKEIGIRKVLGSSEFGIIYLLSKDFSKLVLISILIALPLSYLLIKNWLDSFAYRISLSPWYFLSAGIITLLIAWLTVGTQAFKAARSNPSQCLRDE
ncbi:MAG: ABC transporter permease [Ignavibacteriaceae bacterium]